MGGRYLHLAPSAHDPRRIAPALPLASLGPPMPADRDPRFHGMPPRFRAGAIVQHSGAKVLGLADLPKHSLVHDDEGGTRWVSAWDVRLLGTGEGDLASLAGEPGSPARPPSASLPRPPSGSPQEGGTTP